MTASDQLSFGRFTLIPGARLLLERGQKVRIGSRALDILNVLASRPGEVISKRELVALVWRNAIVEENNLRVHITALRKALGDNGPASEFISNIPGRGYSFVADVSAHRAPTSATPAPPAAETSLPRPLGRIVGREAVLDLLEAQAREHRFMTLVGPGGIGKTTTAITLAARLAHNYADGVGFVDLATISDGTLLPTAIAAQAGAVLSSPDLLSELVGQLRDRTMLLVLDCCEHLIDEVAIVAETLAARVPGLAIIATSREPLRVQGEWVFRLPPLDFPGEEEVPDAARALEFPAVQLFIERVAANLGGYSLSDAEAPAAAEICRRLDGISLAIELAAGRVDTLGIPGLAKSLREGFDALTRGRRTALPRHQTLRATLDWSFARLSAHQKRALAELSLFNKEFTLDAARAVISREGAGDVEGILADLVAKSLVAADRGGHPVRYHLLDMTRAYAAEKLAQSDSRAGSARRHADHYRDLFHKAAEAGRIERKADWLEDYGRDIGNLRAALVWAFSPEGDKQLGVALTVAAIPLWYQLSLIDECLIRVQQSLDWLEQQQVGDPRSLMQLFAALGFPHMRAISGRPNGADAWSRSLTIARQIDDVDFELRALWALWVDRTNSGEPRLSHELAEAFCELARRSADPADRLIGERLRARSLHLVGEQAQAETHIRLMLDAYDHEPNHAHLARFQYEQRITARITLARVLWLKGRSAEALREVDEMIAQALAFNHELTLCHALSDAACPVALLEGDLDRAQRYTDMLHSHTRTHALDVWHAYAECFEGDILIRSGDVEEGCALVRSAMERLTGARFFLYHTAFQSVLAEGLSSLGQEPQALDLLDAALIRCERTGEGWYRAELLRRKGELLMRQGNEAGAALIRQSIETARAQNAIAWERRAAHSHDRLSTV